MNRPRGALFVPVGDETPQQFLSVLQAAAIAAVLVWIASGYGLPERDKLFCEGGQCGKVHRAPPGHGNASLLFTLWNGATRKVIENGSGFVSPRRPRLLPYASFSKQILKTLNQLR